MRRKEKKQLKWKAKQKIITKDKSIAEKQRQKHKNILKQINDKLIENNERHSSKIGNNEIINELQHQISSESQKQVLAPFNIKPASFEIQKNQLVFSEELDGEQNSGQNSDKLEHLMTNNQIYLRQKEQEQINIFLSSSIANILNVVGVTGTGKTTMVINCLKRMCFSYEIINCMEQVDQQKLAQQLINSQLYLNLNAIVIDQCDFCSELNKIIQIIRQKSDTIKIILISNSNCESNLKIRQTVTTVMFLPYTQEQIMEIVSMKLKPKINEIPKIVIIQGMKKAMKKSGDFREVQKHIVQWAQRQHKDQGQFGIPTNFCDPTIKILEAYIGRAGKIANQILINIIELKQLLKRQKRNLSKKQIVCKCQDNVLSRLISQMRRSLSKNECLQMVKYWEDFKILSFCKTRCNHHGRVIQTIDFDATVNIQLVKDLIVKSNYQFQL